MFIVVVYVAALFCFVSCDASWCLWFVILVAVRFGCCCQLVLLGWLSVLVLCVISLCNVFVVWDFVLLWGVLGLVWLLAIALVVGLRNTWFCGHGASSVWVLMVVMWFPFAVFVDFR